MTTSDITRIGLTCRMPDGRPGHHTNVGRVADEIIPRELLVYPLARLVYNRAAGTHQERLAAAHAAVEQIAGAYLVDGHPVPYTATVYYDGESLGYLGTETR